MNIAIVSVEEQYENKRIKEEAEKRGHKAEIFSPDELIAEVGGRKRFDAVLFRPMKGKAVLSRALATTFFSQNSVVVDERIAFTTGRDKFNNYWGFFNAGLHVPKTIVLNPKAIEEVKTFSSKEIVVKDISGKRGSDLFKCKKEELHSLMKKLDKEKNYIIQEFIPIEKELRILVVGDKVLGAFSKETCDWKHNIALGAKPIPFPLTEELKEIALKAAKSVQLEITGVDVALSKGKWFVLETNRSPQFKGFESATKINVAEEIVKYLEEKFEKQKK
ncbi:MAG: RimK family alpha-L-glutamate ligase [archaeon]